jgi:hypothetical protein
MQPLAAFLVVLMPDYEIARTALLCFNLVGFPLSPSLSRCGRPLAIPICFAPRAFQHEVIQRPKHEEDTGTTEEKQHDDAR